MIRSPLFAALLAALVGPFATAGHSAFADAPLGCSPKPAPPADDFSEPPNFSLAVPLLKQKLIYYRCTRYDADIAKIVDDALAWVKYRAPQLPAPAIVLDIDETSLSNWTRIFRDKFEYIPAGPCDLGDDSKPCGDGEWERSESAPAIAATLALYKFARCIELAPPCRPIEVFFITGRKENWPAIRGKTPRQWTRENLIAVGYAGVDDDHLILRSDHDNGVADYKSGARAEIETKRHLTIIANLGDQESDLVGGHAERPFKLPDPFYYIPP